MADIVNDRDVLIMATVPRFTPPTDRGMFLTPSTALFKVSSGGIGAPASILFQATLLNMSGAVNWTWSDGMAPTVNGNELTLPYANFSAVTGTITAQVTVDGVLYTQVANVSKVVDGSSSSVQLLEVSTTSQVFKVSKEGANDPTSITITATAQNLTGTPSFTIPYGTATLSAGASSNQKILTFANMATDSVTIKVSLGGLEDNVTIIKVREGADGSDGLAALLTNESHTLPASTDGTVASVSGAVTTMKVYKGTVDDSANWTYAFSPGSSASTLSYTTSGGTLSVTGMNSGVDTASVDITASKAGASSITKRFTVTKSKTGATGSGQQGQRGNVDISAVTNSSVWSDTEAVAALVAAGYGAPQVRDMVNLYKADRTFSVQKMYNGSAWVTVDYVYNGNVFVKGSILPEALDTRGLTVRELDGTIIVGAGTALNELYAAAGTRNSDLTPSISAAQQAADAANTAIANIASDNVLSKGEKADLMLEWAKIEGEKPGIVGLAVPLSVDSTTYVNAYNGLSGYLLAMSPSWSDTSRDTPIDGSQFRTSFSSYYDARQSLLNACADKNRQLADAAAQAAADAVRTAQTYADAKAGLAQVTAQAYADGVVDAAEERAIADATAKAEAARVAAEAAAAADATAKAAVAATTAQYDKVEGRPYDVSSLVKKGNFADGSTGSWEKDGIENVVNSGSPFAKNMWLRRRDALEVGNSFPVTPGEVIYFEAWLETTLTDYRCWFGIKPLDKDGNNAGWTYGCSLASRNGWTHVKGSAVVPENAITATPWINMDGFDFSNQFLRVAELWVGRHERGATVGATWGSNIAGQPANNQILNELQQWAQIIGSGKPEDNATLGAMIGQNLGGQFTAANISTYIAAAAIDLALINKASIANLAALSAVIGLLRSATTGQRYELSDQGYQWFNAQNVPVIQIGNF